MFYFSVHIANKINPILVMFLLISFTTIYGSDFNLSYGQISLVPDNSLIAQTADCITSMMTSALIGVNSNCTDKISKINSTYPDSNTTPASSSSTPSNNNPDSNTTPASSSSTPSNNNPDSNTTPASSSSTPSNNNPDSNTTPASSSSTPSNNNHNPYNLSKNNPFYHEFQTKNNTTSDDSMSIFTSDSSNPIDSNYASTFTSSPQDNPSTFMKSPPQDNPSTFSGLQQQSINQPVSNPYSFQSLHTTINKYPNTVPIPASTQSDDIGNSLEGKNKHSKEISECFDRAFSIDNYLSDSEIIECAKDRDSFSQNSLNNYALSDKIENNDNKDNDGKTDNKHSKEISECFDRAFSIDNYLSDSEIIECAKDRDSFK